MSDDDAVLALARKLCEPLLPNVAPRLRLSVVGEIYRGCIDESLDTDAASQLGRVARRAVAWDGPAEWLGMVSDGAVDSDLPIATLPLPEGYRTGLAALEHLPRPLATRLDAELAAWAQLSGGMVPPHRIRLWRERVACVQAHPLKVWVGLTSESPLLVIRERTPWQVAHGAGMTVLAGVGAGGFGLALSPWLGIGAFVLGSSIAGATAFEALRRRYRPLWSHQGIGSR